MKSPLPKIVIMTKCTGEAHSNGHIDNCMVCLPYGWGFVPLNDHQLKADRNGRKVKWTRESISREYLEFALMDHFTLTRELAMDLVRDLEVRAELKVRPKQAHTIDCRCGRCL